MSLSVLASLPDDILLEICSLLYGSHKPSLRSLSLVDKRCCNAATIWQFRHLKIKVQDPASLRRDLNKLHCMLERRNAFRSVRHITVFGHLTVYTSVMDDPLGTQQDLRDSDWPDHDEVHGLNMARYQLRESMLPQHLQPMSNMLEGLASFWQPFAPIVEKIACLQYFDYNCVNSFPPNILKALEQHQPTCQIHVDNFCYGILTNNFQASNVMALTQSPNLSSLYAEHFKRGAIGRRRYIDFINDQKDILHAILRASPSLKKVYLDLTGDPLHWATTLPDSPEPEAHWEQFVESLGSTRPALLDSFTMSTYLPRSHILAATRVVDFANLQHLDFRIGVDRELLEYLVRNITFTRLESLCLSLSRLPEPPNHPISVQPPDLSNLYREWFTHLPPLKSLVLSGYVTSTIIKPALVHHGSSLRSLRIDMQKTWLPPPGFDVDLCHLLKDTCHGLEELKIPILRSRSQGDEVLCYRLLSQCPSLRDLFIKLRCNSPALATPDDPTPAANTPDFDNDDTILYDHDHHPGRLRVGSVRHAMIDCAVDADLARSIWHLIADDKQGRLLRTLKINTNDAWDCGHAPLRVCLNAMVRAFLLERPLRDDSDEEVQIRELDQRAREASLKRVRKYEGMWKRETKAERDQSPMMQVFRRLWPERKKGSVDWRDDWHSFPLQFDESGKI